MQREFVSDIRRWMAETGATLGIAVVGVEVRIYGDPKSLLLFKMTWL